MKYGESFIEYSIEGDELIKTEGFRDPGNDIYHTRTEVVMSREAFIMCFNKWIDAERRMALDRERRIEQHRKDELEWRNNLATELKEIENAIKEGRKHDE